VDAEGLFMKPTAVGLMSTIEFRLQNQSRVPLVFHFSLPDRLRDVFTIAPAGGRLKGKEVKPVQVGPSSAIPASVLTASPTG
jgi:uncharacterized protein (DUF58 family)